MGRAVVKALIFLLAWVAVGAWVAARGARPLGEQALAVLFWPFFLGHAAPVPSGPLQRLRAALGEGSEPAVAELERALNRLEARLQAVEAALRGLDPAGSGEVARAQETSRQLLRQARERYRQERDAALAAIEETATRLVLAREDGGDAAVRQILAELRAHLLAAEEVSGPPV